MKKKLLFVINTLSRAGAEMALMELLRRLNPEEYDISLFVLMGQGEMVTEVPEYVRICNSDFCPESVLTAAGRKHMVRRVLKAMVSRGTVLRRLPFLVSQVGTMAVRREFQVDKLLWPVLADGAERLDEEFDLAVAYLEGGSAVYTAKHVKAKKKAAFVHTNYLQAGYTRHNDDNCYMAYDQVFAVSKEALEPFYTIYPELRNKVDVFHNILNIERIEKKSREPGGFPETDGALRILSVGRLIQVKAFELCIDAMKLLKDSGIKAEWYVLGEGDQRSFLEARIRENGLEEDFFLMGAVENPYPWFAQCDLYVHCSRYEGKSIAIQEAQILGCAMLVSDCSGNREQVTDGVNGKLCNLSAQEICDGIRELIANPEKTQSYRLAAAEKYRTQKDEMDKLYALMR